jgi:hypothetical protein
MVSLAFVTGGLWIAGVLGEATGGSRRLPGGIEPVVGWVCIVFFGGRGLLQLRNALSGGVAIRIDENGILAPALSKKTIGWNDILDVRRGSVAGTEFVVLDVTAAHAKGFGLYWRLSRPLNNLLYGEGWPVMVNASNRSVDDVLEAVLALRPLRSSRPKSESKSIL